MEIGAECLNVEYDRTSIGQRNSDLSILLEISNALASSMDLHAILQRSLDRVLENFAFEAGRIYLMVEGGDCLNLVAWRGIEPKGLETVRVDQGFTGRSARTRSFIAQRVTDLEDRERVRLLLGKGYEMIVCVPLVSLDEVVGVMNLARHAFVEMDSSAVDLLMVLGSQIANAANSVKLYQEVEAKVAEIRKKKETIKFFAFSASHDLKSPAVGLHGLVGRFLRTYGDALDPKGRAMCRQMHGASGHIVALTEKLNGYIAAKESPLHIEPVCFEDVARAVGGEFAPALEARGIRWSGPGPAPPIQADRLSLVRFLQNCVDNALKYGGAGLSEIRVCYRGNGDEHVLSVCDDGVGMKPEAAERVFDLFHRHDTSRGTDGVGLGLAIVREIAQRHGGRAWVETAPGDGAAFHLAIPNQTLEAAPEG